MHNICNLLQNFLEVFFLEKRALRNFAVLQFCRLNEAVMHFGESIKDIINEEFGDGM